jgi:hypothetical protein
LDLFADRTSCHRFVANQFRLLLSSAAYVLVQALRWTALAGTELGRGTGGNDPPEVVQGGGAGGGDGASGGVSPVEQLPVPDDLSGGLCPFDGSAKGVIGWFELSGGKPGKGKPSRLGG